MVRTRGGRWWQLTNPRPVRSARPGNNGGAGAAAVLAQGLHWVVHA
jgi:hypothetical protein